MDIKLLEKFYKNECTPEEAKKVLSWFEQEELQQAEEAALEAVWQHAELDANEPAYAHDADKLLANILAKKESKSTQATDEDTPVWPLLAVALLLPVLFV
ncbi:hypothetical protein POKO110462_17980 [Pontibacter korlensis]|uniref:Uncharacterized protein n=1 Tax=Pontibacter korlensis TaxID=400092 RepID=A0A0E3ZG65_9BACT|nr:hypothetical protein [Pontibacter korlensis]AKD03949.1 hypothetical protein PKOR_13635 [Pontibacter korlensis]